LPWCSPPLKDFFLTGRECFFFTRALMKFQIFLELAANFGDGQQPGFFAGVM
jgi:hypothetical protein